MQGIGTISINDTRHRLQEMYNTIVLAGCLLSTPLPSLRELCLGWTRLDALCIVPQERDPPPPFHLFIKGLKGDRNHLTELEDSDRCYLN